MGRKLRDVEDRHQYNFWCPGCGHYHPYRTGWTESDRAAQEAWYKKWKPGKPVQFPTWTWNGSYEAPTFNPSLLIECEGDVEYGGNIPPSVCHLYVTDGKIHYLNDCTHALKGQTVEMRDEQ